MHTYLFNFCTCLYDLFVDCYVALVTRRGNLKRDLVIWRLEPLISSWTPHICSVVAPSVIPITSLHKGCQWKKKCTLTFSMDFPIKWSINDGKMCQNFCEWDLFLIIQILGMHYGTLKMRKALPFCVSSFHPIFWLKSLPLCIYRWER